MKKTVLLLLGITATLGSCQKDKLAPSKDVSALKEQFHGKYKIVSVTSDLAVDLNEDGRFSTNLSDEIPGLSNSDFEVLIGNNSPKNDYIGMAVQFWQHQNVTRNWNYSSPDSLMVLGFVNQPTYRYFNFNAALTRLQLEQLLDAPADEGQYPAPESIAVAGPEQLLVVTNRLLFVRKAWKPVRITALYKRYTKTT
ncbi:hypothetical protein [Hymenobacter ruricola]|uniref:Uncharacterized protein n=1 Tax=Hymenobacter ruricola TaxID=2791023 RepID=A0ABS0I049_9BACT|nr:hypothetical protein [Hymenobacter ruricola]MBF9220310.1 hypothetical protein [Hymenobacter ruricola]